MTNKEAIEQLLPLAKYSVDKNGVGTFPMVSTPLQAEAIDIAIKSLEEVKGLRLLADWAVECGFGFDNIPEEYEKYKEEISDMGYTEGLVYIARKEAENEL